MYFLLKNGDIPASYVSLPEGIFFAACPMVRKPAATHGCFLPSKHRTLQSTLQHLASFTGGLPHATVVVGDVLNLTSYVSRFGGDTSR